MTKSRRFSFLTFSSLGDGSTSETTIFPRPTTASRLSTGPTPKAKKRMSLPVSFPPPSQDQDRCASRSSSLAVTVGAPSPLPQAQPVLAAPDTYANTNTNTSNSPPSPAHSRRHSLSRSLSVNADTSLHTSSPPPSPTAPHSHSRREHDAPGFDAWIAQQRALSARGAYDVGAPISIHGDVSLPLSGDMERETVGGPASTNPNRNSNSTSTHLADPQSPSPPSTQRGGWTRLLSKRTPKHAKQSPTKFDSATHATTRAARAATRPPSSYVDTDTGYESSAPTWMPEYHAVDGPEGASRPTGRWRGESWVRSSTLGRASQTPSGTASDSARCDSGCAGPESVSDSSAYTSDMHAAHEWMSRQDVPADRGAPSELCHLERDDGGAVQQARVGHARWEDEQGQRERDGRRSVNKRNSASNSNSNQNPNSTSLAGRCWGRNRVVLDREREIKAQRVSQAWEDNRDLKPHWVEGKRFAELHAGTAETGTLNGTSFAADAKNDIKTTDVSHSASGDKPNVHTYTKPAPSAFPAPRSRSRASSHRYSLDNSRPPAHHIFAHLWPFRRGVKKLGDESRGDQDGTTTCGGKENVHSENDDKSRWKRFSAPPVSDGIRNVADDGPVRVQSEVDRYEPSPKPSWPSSVSQFSSTPPSASSPPSQDTSPAASSAAPSMTAQPGSPKPIATAWPAVNPDSIIKRYLDINREEYDAKVVAQTLHDDEGYTNGEDPGVRDLTVEETTAFPWHVVLTNPAGNENKKGQLFLDLRGISYALPDLSVRGAHLNREDVYWETLKRARIVDTWGNVLNLVALSKHLTAVRVVRLVLRGRDIPLSLNIRCENLITFTYVPWSSEERPTENGDPAHWSYNPCTVEVGPVPTGVRRLVINVTFDDRSPSMKIARFARIPAPATLAEVVIIFQRSVYLNAQSGAATSKLRLTRTPLIDSLLAYIVALSGSRISLVGAELLSGTDAAHAQRVYHHTLADFGVTDAAARMRVVSHDEYRAEVGRHVYALETDTSG